VEVRDEYKLVYRKKFTETTSNIPRTIKEACFETV